MSYIHPHQIINRISELVKEQQSKGHKSGWVFHKMNDLVEQKRKHLLPYNLNTGDSIQRMALGVAKGEWTLNEVSEQLNEQYRTFTGMEAKFG